MICRLTALKFPDSPIRSDCRNFVWGLHMLNDTTSPFVRYYAQSKTGRVVSIRNDIIFLRKQIHHEISRQTKNTNTVTEILHDRRELSILRIQPTLFLSHFHYQYIHLYFLVQSKPLSGRLSPSDVGRRFGRQCFCAELMPTILRTNRTGRL